MYMPIHWPGHNYLGPGSKDFTAEPIDEDDRIAQVHDLDYELAVTPKDIRSADKRAISAFALDFISSGNYHSAVGAIGLGGKYAIERVLGRPLYPDMNSLDRQSYDRSLYLLRLRFLSKYARSNSISFSEAQLNQGKILCRSKDWKQEVKELCLQFIQVPEIGHLTATSCLNSTRAFCTSIASLTQGCRSLPENTSVDPFDEDKFNNLICQPVDQATSVNITPNKPRPLLRGYGFRRKK